MNNHQIFSKNLKQVMINKGYPPKASVLEKIFNLAYYGKPIGLHGVAKWLRGESIPPFDKLQVLAEILEISVQDLLGEEIEKKITPPTEKRLSRSFDHHFWNSAASYHDQKLFQAFLDLPPQQKNVVREVILALHKIYAEDK